MEAGRPEGARREGVRPELRALSPANGKGIPGTFPALDGSPIATGDKAGHIEIVLFGGKKNPAMAAWGKQLSDTDIAAVITYERNSWGNHTGQPVQPKEVKAARGKAA